MDDKKKDWLEYKINVDKGGKFKVNFRIASAKDSFPLGITSKIDKKEFILQGTGNWQNWETYTKDIDIRSGESVITISGVDVNINWFELIPFN